MVHAWLESWTTFLRHGFKVQVHTATVTNSTKWVLSVRAWLLICFDNRTFTATITYTSVQLYVATIKSDFSDKHRLLELILMSNMFYFKVKIHNFINNILVSVPLRFQQILEKQTPFNLAFTILCSLTSISYY